MLVQMRLARSLKPAANYIRLMETRPADGLKRGLRIIATRLHVEQTSNTQHRMAMLPNANHPGHGCSCRDCLNRFPDIENTFEHVEITSDGELQPIQFKQLNWNDRADLRFILKHASQSAMFPKDIRDLAMRLMGELTQLPLEF
jgi:hypothetical protein